jgi:predicted nucleic acid-binding protein
VIFLDRNIISETMRAAPDTHVKGWLREQKPDLSVSTVVLGEILFGIAKVRPQERSPRWTIILKEWRIRFVGNIHAFDEPSAEIYGEIMGQSHRSGLNLSMADAMIAAVALRHGAALATRNTKHFETLGIPLINPWEHEAGRR